MPPAEANKEAIRAGERTDQQPHRRRLPGEVPSQPIPQPDDRRTRSLRDSQGHAARAPGAIERGKTVSGVRLVA
jgi:hypothetical protein